MKWIFFLTLLLVHILDKVKCQCLLSEVERPTERCCRCIALSATCNEEDTEFFPGFNCNEVDYDEDSTSCRLTDDTEISSPLGLRHTERGDLCIKEDKKLCCSPLPKGVLANEIGEGAVAVNFDNICDQYPAIAAVQNFSKGVSCGKRDSRLYYNYENARDDETNPGEWPWVVAIFEKERDPSTGRRKYLSAGTLLHNSMVATVAHHMVNFKDKPAALVVHIGDWDLSEDYDPLNGDQRREEYSHIEMDVSCIKIHPRADLDNTLANNVAVLKLTPGGGNVAGAVTPKRPSVRDLVGLKSVPPADQPEQLVTGILSRVFDVSCSAPEFYGNSVCLPIDADQFANHLDECFVAAWGEKPYEQKGQREVHLKVLSKGQCIDKLGPEFTRRGLVGWEPQDSELCAQGENGQDTCKGEGGSPLVCLDKDRDQFFAVGLVNYGFGCYKDIPAVYVNLAEPGVKDFIIKEISNETC